jgi:hypothetical protein
LHRNVALHKEQSEQGHSKLARTICYFPDNPGNMSGKTIGTSNDELENQSDASRTRSRDVRQTGEQDR